MIFSNLFSGLNLDHSIYVMEHINYYINSGAPWFEEEIERLKKEYSENNMNLLQISKLHKRTPGGIATRLVILKLARDVTDVLGYNDYKNSVLYKEVLAKHRPVITRHFGDISSIQKVQEDKPLAVKGYIYCMSNASMPGIMKVGLTMRTPEERLKEANKSDTFKPPTMYQIEFAKYVTSPLIKEKVLHDLLERYKERIHPQREFFRVSSSEVRRFFDLIDGEWWRI
jgi:hypothetical protein